MAANRVKLAGIDFPIKNFVRLQDIAVPPNPVIFGDTSKAGDSAAMIQLIQSSFTGGQGVYKGNSRTDTERTWQSHLENRYRLQTGLPPLSVQMGRPPTVSASSPVSLIFPFNNEVYIAFGSEVYRWIDSSATFAKTAVGSIYRYALTGGGWTTKEYTLPGNPTDAIRFKTFLYVACGSTYSTRTVAGAWSDASGGPGNYQASYFAKMDEKLWRLGLDPATGVYTMYYTVDGITWTTGGALDTDVTAHDLVTFRDASGALALYALADIGPWLYDATNNIWKITELEIPPLQAPNKSIGRVWRDSRLYVTTGDLGMAAVQAGNPMVTTPMGLDRDDGVVAEEQGRIVAVASDVNWLLALVDMSQASSSTAFPYGSGVVSEAHGAHGIDLTPSGSVALKAWNGTGWTELWYDKIPGTGAGNTMLISSAYSKRRVYWNSNGQLYYQALPAGVYNPLHNSASLLEYGPLFQISPWWEYGTGVQRKVHGHFFLNVRGASALNTVKIYYQTDFNETSWTQFGSTITTNGIIDLSPGAIGVQCRWIRFMVELTRDPDNLTSGPVVEYMTSEVMRVLPPTFAYGFELDLTAKPPVGRKTMDQLVEILKQLCDPSVYPGFYSMSYRDSLQADHNYYGRISRLNGTEATPEAVVGQGTYLVSFIVPYPSD